MTGGGGFLGGAIVRKLRERGEEVVSYSRGEYPELARLGVRHVRGDLVDRDRLGAAAAGCDVVFHVAALAGLWGDEADYRRANVDGTQAVLDVCKRLGIRRLVYTSSPSVTFTGKDTEGADESLPYPTHFEAHYPRTKAAAEKLVRAANGPRLATVSLRPHLIWGPGDHHLAPRLIERARKGQLRRIGHRRTRVDAVYVDNAADAHLLAADRLEPGGAIAGNVYFISNDEPIETWEFIDRVLVAGGVGPLKRNVSFPVAIALAAGCELLWTILGRKDEPRLTRFLVRELATSHWYDISAAKRDLGYRPAVSMEEGLARLGAWLAKKDSGFGAAAVVAGRPG